MPSSTNDDVFDLLREEIAEIKQTFGAIRDNLRAIIPVAIGSLAAQEQYVDLQSLVGSDFQHEDPADSKIADTVVKSLAPRFLEGIAISSRGTYMFIAEVQVYLRASPAVDDCANSTITVAFPSNPLFVIEQKREFTNQWYEAKIYYERFEFLVTGCVFGKSSSKEMQAVLEASFGKAVINDSYWRVYVPSNNIASVQDVRLLRNFTKTASGYKWRFKSKRFHNMTTSDTETTCNKYNTSIGGSLKRHEKNHHASFISVKYMEIKGLFFFDILCFVC